MESKDFHGYMGMAIMLLVISISQAIILEFAKYVEGVGKEIVNGMINYGWIMGIIISLIMIIILFALDKQGVSE